MENIDARVNWRKDEFSHYSEGRIVGRCYLGTIAKQVKYDIETDTGERIKDVTDVVFIRAGNSKYEGE